MLNVYEIPDHEIHWVGGGSAIVVAKNKPTAIKLMNDELASSGLDHLTEDQIKQVKKINLTKEEVISFFDGSY